MSSCRQCSHANFAHEHYRSGSDCSECSCTRFHTSFLPAITSRLGRHATVTLETQPKQTTTAA